MSNLVLTVGYTLIDVTNTGEVSSSNTVARNQQRNWETLVQVLGLRTQVTFLSPLEIIELDMSNTLFGSKFSGKQKVWTFKFGVEPLDVFANSASAHGTLENDFTSVPIIIGLEESVSLVIPAFVISGEHRNIYFKSFEI